MSKKYNKVKPREDNSMSYLVTIITDDDLTTYSFRSIKSAYKFACIWYIIFEETFSGNKEDEELLQKAVEQYDQNNFEQAYLKFEKLTAQECYPFVVTAQIVQKMEDEDVDLEKIASEIEEALPSSMANDKSSENDSIIINEKDSNPTVWN